mgnify:CR=1 FL=1
MNLHALRIGEGWDTHQLVTGRPLVLGGVTIPHSHGLLGHSDADALLHAITDALLGAAALGDIGRHFPDTDPRFKGADSMVLLAEAARRVREAGYAVGNIDSTVIAQAPKLSPHIPAMVARIAALLGVAPGQVTVSVRLVGYAPRAQRITVRAGETATADFAQSPTWRCAISPNSPWASTSRTSIAMVGSTC